MSEPEKEEQPREPDGTARPASDWSTAGSDASVDPITTSNVKCADAEDGLLGRMLHPDFGAEAIADAARILTWQAFFARPNATVFRRAVEMHERSEPVDWVTLSDELKRHGEDASAADGAATIELRLQRLIDAVPSGADAAHYARIVLRYAERRRLIEACERAKRDFASHVIPFEATREELVRAVSETRSSSSSAVTFESVDELIEQGGTEVDYIVDRLIPDRALLLIVGKPKAGKSVFVFALLGALERGESFCGRSSVQTSAIVLSEEERTTIGQKARRFGVKKARFLTRAQLAKCGTFAEVVGHAVQEAKRKGARVLVVDTFAAWARFGRDEEKDAGAVTVAMRPLLAAVAEGLSVLLIHHSRKGDADQGDAVRGSSAIYGSADSLIELQRVDPRLPASTMRRLICTSRYEGVPPEVYVELKDDRFVVADRPEVAEVADIRRRIRELLEEASPDQLTRKEILEELGGNTAAAGSALKAMADAGEIGRNGTGRKGKPFVFFALPGGKQFDSIPPPIGEGTELNPAGRADLSSKNGALPLDGAPDGPTPLGAGSREDGDEAGPDPEDGVVDLGEDLDDGVGAGP